jgi:hypothetical protein
MTRACLFVLLCVSCAGPSVTPDPAPSSGAAQPGPPTAATPQPAGAPSIDRIPLGSPAQLTLGDPVKGPAWCWKDPRTVDVNDYRPAYAFVLLQRSMLAVLRAPSAADSTLADVKQLRDERVADKLPLYVITATPFDADSLATDDIHVVNTAFPSAARAFDQQRDVILLQLDVQGLVANPGGGDGLRVSVERKRISGVSPYKSSGLAIMDYCVVFQAPSTLTIYRRLVMHS